MCFFHYVPLLSLVVLTLSASGTSRGLSWADEASVTTESLEGILSQQKGAVFDTGV